MAPSFESTQTQTQTQTQTVPQDALLLKHLDKSPYKAGPYNHHVVEQEAYKYAHLLPNSDRSLKASRLSDAGGSRR